jgi:diguanylate cyclase (GGDEF)-like protein
MNDFQPGTSKTGPGAPAPDREGFLRRIDDAVEAGAPFAVLVMDIEKLREINIGASHEIADELLTRISTDLGDALRREDILARTVGGTYAMLLTRMMSEDHARLAAYKAIHTATRAHRIAGHDLSVGVHVGLAMFPDHGANGAELLTRAEFAMYRAKSERADICIYDPSHDPPLIPQARYERELRSAIHDDTLTLEFQPKIHMGSGTLCGAETLARWPDCPLGPISPTRFVQIAEQGSLINDLTLWTINAALRHCADWHRLGAHISVSVNLSTRVLLDDALPQLIARSLETWGVPPEFLILEITETALMARRGQVDDALRELAEMGVVWSIDDFGSGYSSLAYLQTLPVRELKIDRTFIQDLNKRNKLIVRAIIQLAHGLDLTVTAEGVETTEGRDDLIQLGCDIGQGFFFGRPLGPDAFLDELKAAAWPIGPDCSRM